MPNYTGKGLIKPAGAENIDITQLNANFDRLNDFAMGCYRCTSTTHPTGADVWVGLLIYETDTNNILAYDGGGNWVSPVTTVMRTVYTSGSGTFVKPANAAKLLVRAVGGGGGGAGATSTTAGQSSAGAGGGAGAYVESLFNANAVTTNIAYAVGAGGAGGAGGGTGNTGDDTRFGPSGSPYVLAKGGQGASARGSSAVVNSLEGAIGGSGTGSVGLGTTIKIPGGMGGPAIFFGSTAIGGHGGASVLGGSVRGRNAATAGTQQGGGDGLDQGGGGGGGASAGVGNSVTGGAGAAGCLIIDTYF